MEIETIQNVVLIGIGIVLFMVYITSKTWDSIADDMDRERQQK
ncbi:MAG: hypothetical protein ACP5D3_02040 [Sulfurovum sp.]